MSSNLQVGDIVCNPQKPEWGDGTVKSVGEKKISIHFPKINATKQFICELSPIKLITPFKGSQPNEVALEKLIECICNELMAQNLKPFEQLGRPPNAQPAANKTKIQEVVNNIQIQGWRFGPTHDEAAEKTVERLWRKAHDLDVRLFASHDVSLIPSYNSIEEMLVNHKGNPFHTMVYAIPNLSVPDIVEFARVNDNGNHEWKDVKRRIQVAFSIWAFEIIIARSDYLAGKFIEPITDKRVLHQLISNIPAGTFDLTAEEAITKSGFVVGWD